MTGARHPRQQDGDTRAYGWYTLRYSTRETGERRDRHVIEALTPAGPVIGRLVWLGTGGKATDLDVADGRPENGGPTGGHEGFGDTCQCDNGHWWALIQGALIGPERILTVVEPPERGAANDS